jgi:hypothetical protein
MTNIFEKASRLKLSFASVKGSLTVEDLWDLPLTSKNGCDLDTIAKAVNKDLKASEEESFVTPASNPQRSLLELRLEILKHIIVTRQAENQAALARKGREAELNRLVEILAKKQDEAMMGMTPEEIQARINELKNAA